MMSGKKLKVWYLVYTFASIDFDEAALIFYTEAAQRWNTHWHREQDSEEETCASLGSMDSEQNSRNGEGSWGVEELDSQGTKKSFCLYPHTHHTLCSFSPLASKING